MGILLEQRIQGQGGITNGSPESACLFVNKLQGAERGPEAEIHRKAGMQGRREGVWLLWWWEDAVGNRHLVGMETRTFAKADS